MESKYNLRYNTIYDPTYTHSKYFTDIEKLKTFIESKKDDINYYHIYKIERIYESDLILKHNKVKIFTH